MDAQGNKPFWQQRCRYTPFKIFSSPATLWRAAGQYFAYMDAGTGGVPLKPGKKTAAPAGDSSPAPAPVIATYLPYSMQGLCTFLGVPYKTFIDKTRGNAAFDDVVALLNDIIYTQQFTGAALGVFNATIIGRRMEQHEKQNQEAEDTDWKITLNLNHDDAEQSSW